MVQKAAAYTTSRLKAMRNHFEDWDNNKKKNDVTQNDVVTFFDDGHNSLTIDGIVA